MSLGKKVGLPTADFIREAIEIIDRAREKGVVLRILGAVGIYIHSMDKPENLRIYSTLKRFEGEESLFTDLDLIGYSKQRKDIIDFFEKTLRFKTDPYVKALFGVRRLVYYHPQDLYHVDIFFDKLEFSHDVYFGDRPGRGRLELDYPTISLADLALEKLQIHEINRKDLVDLIVLFYSHRLCRETSVRDRECIDDDYIASVLSEDWGFWYDATTNLRKLSYMISSQLASLEPDIARVVGERINLLLDSIDRKPKSKEWIKRSKIGISKPWYRVVEELER